MNTGHDGSMGTLHANNPREALSRCESMITMGGFSLPSRTIREMICASIDVIVQAARLRDGSRRITHITEVMGMEGDTIITQDLFLYDMIGEDANGKIIGRHRSTGIGRPRFWERARYYGEEKRLAAALDAAEVNATELRSAAMNMQDARTGLSRRHRHRRPGLGLRLSARCRARTKAESPPRLDRASRTGRGAQAEKTQRSRREQVEGSLKELEARAPEGKVGSAEHPPRPRPGSTWTTQKFWIISGVLGAVCFRARVLRRRRPARRRRHRLSPPASACRAGSWAS